MRNRKPEWDGFKAWVLARLRWEGLKAEEYVVKGLITEEECKAMRKKAFGL